MNEKIASWNITKKSKNILHTYVAIFNNEEDFELKDIKLSMIASWREVGIKTLSEIGNILQEKIW